MSEQEQSRVQSIDDIDVVVDADAHVQEPLDEVFQYLEGKYDGIKDLLELSSLPYSEIWSVSTPSPMYIHEAMGGNFILDDSDPLSKTIELQDELEIDTLVISANLGLNIQTVQNDRFAVALAEASNSWLLDQIRDREGLKAQITMAGQKPSKAAEEIERVGSEDDVVGVQLPMSGLIPPAGHEQYEPIFEAAQDHGLPVCMHSAPGSVTFPPQHNWSETFAEDHATQHPWQHMWNLTTLMFRGVPERFPDLEFVFQEAGIGWAAYMLQRLDDHYLEFGYEIPGLNRLPSEYFADQFYVTTQPLGKAKHPKHTAWMVEMIGADSVMFSGDVPHADFDTPAELFDPLRPYFDNDELQQIMGGTATEVFGL